MNIENVIKTIGGNEWIKENHNRFYLDVAAIEKMVGMDAKKFGGEVCGESISNSKGWMVHTALNGTYINVNTGELVIADGGKKIGRYMTAIADAIKAL